MYLLSASHDEVLVALVEIEEFLNESYSDHSKTDDEDDLSAAWIVIKVERSNGKFMGSRRRNFVRVHGTHFLRLRDKYLSHGKKYTPQTTKRSMEGEVVVHHSGGAIRKLDGDSRP